MQKPSIAITSNTDWDYDLIERVTRALEHSPLHVRAVLGQVSVPAELGGDPRDPYSALGFDMALITDLQRGWLVLTQADEEYDWTSTIDDVLGEMVQGDSAPWVGRTALSFVSEPPVATALDLRCDAQARIEAEFERHFGEASRLPTKLFSAFDAGFAEFGFSVMEEVELRRKMNEPFEGFGVPSAC